MCAALQPQIFSAGGLLCTAQFAGRAQFWVLEGLAQFSTLCIVIGGTVRRKISGRGIVIGRTFPEKTCCYLQHSLPGRAAGFLKNLLLSNTQFGEISGIFRVVIGGTVWPPGQNPGCYVRHNSKNPAEFSPVVICSTFSGQGLLFSAQFTMRIIFIFSRRVLLFTAHFAKKRRESRLSCCYLRHNSRKKSCYSCYSAHNSAKILLFPGGLLAPTQFQEFSSGVVIHGTI